MKTLMANEGKSVDNSADTSVDINETDTATMLQHDLNKAVPFLVARAGARMGDSFSKALEPYGVSLVEWRVCAALNHRPHQTLTVLSTNASVDLSALSRIIDRLEKSELVVREKSETDGRAMQLALTDLGQSVVEAIIPMAQHFEEVATNDFTAAEVKQLRSMLDRLYANATPLA